MKTPQVAKLYELLKDGRPHSVKECIDWVYNVHEGVTGARLAARVNDLKKLGHEIKGFNQGKDSWGRSIYHYQLIKKEVIQDALFQVQIPRSYNHIS